MGGKKRPGNHRGLSGMAKNVLRDVRDDFTSKGLSANALTEHYVGLSISALRQKYCEGAGATQVDFDLALKALEDGLFVNTGPLVPFDNPPGSSVFIFGSFSKREYMYLTEAGYRAAAQISDQKPGSNLPHVHISGGTFHQSQIGIGEQVGELSA
jgi:hypothetical protein